MYLLTARWLFPKDERPAPRVRPRKRKRSRGGLDPEPKRITPRSVTPRSAVSHDAEQERRRKAAAVAVAIAYAEKSPAVLFSDVPSDWKLLHRARRLSASALRRKARA
jgi:hypothetical protein